MKITQMRSRAASAIAGLAGISLALSACGAADSSASAPSQGTESTAATAEAEAGVVYQFDEARVVDEDDQVPFVATDADGPITVRLSEDLAQAVPAELSVAVDHYVVTTHAFSTGVCRINAEIFYADGGQEALTQATSEYSGDPVANVAASLVGTSPGQEEEIHVVDDLPGDDAIEDGATYVTSDAKKLTVVNSCAEDAGDTEWAPVLEFPYTTRIEDLPYRENLAAAYIAVLPGGNQGAAGGTTTIIRGEVDADVSPNGTWRAK